MSEALFEPPVVEDATPAPLASLDYVIPDSKGRAPGPVSYLGVSNYGRADARALVWHDSAAGGMLYVTNAYEGPTRAFVGRQASVGAKPSVGGVVYGLMYPLHFGHFAGLMSKAVWGALGIAMCFVILSGFRLSVRRRAEVAAWRRFGHAVQVFGYGLPIGMVACAYGFFLSRPAADPFWWTPASFVLGAALAVGIGLRIADEDRLGMAFQRVLGAGRTADRRPDRRPPAHPCRRDAAVAHAGAAAPTATEGARGGRRMSARGVRRGRRQPGRARLPRRARSQAQARLRPSTGRAHADRAGLDGGFAAWTHGGGLGRRRRVLRLVRGGRRSWLGGGRFLTAAVGPVVGAGDGRSVNGAAAPRVARRRGGPGARAVPLRPPASDLEPRVRRLETDLAAIKASLAPPAADWVVVELSGEAARARRV